MTESEEPPTTKNPTLRMRRIPARVWADILVLAALSILGVLGFASSFGGNGYLLAGVGGLAVGIAAAALTYMLRWGALPTVAVALAAYFLLGSAIAIPSQAIFGVLPSVQSMTSLLTGAVFGWADIVTLATPVGAPAYIAAVPYTATWLVGLVSTLLVTRWSAPRSRSAVRASVALIGPFALYIVGIITGTEDSYLAGVRGVSFAVVALVWLGWRRGSEERVIKVSSDSLFRRKLIGTVGVVGAAVLIGALVGTLVVPSAFARFVLRDEIQPPFDPLDYPSPLAGFRHYTKDAADQILFTVEGLEAGEVIRLATMDSYTGKLWNVAGPELAEDGSGTFTLVGREIPEPTLATSGSTSDVTVTIDAYSDVWLPSIGYANSIDFSGAGASDSEDLRYNVSTGAAVLTSGVDDGLSYTVSAELQKVPTSSELAQTATAPLQLPPVDNVPDIVNAKAEEFAGDEESPFDKLSAIVAALQNDGYLSHGLKSDAVPSQAGHGADRMNLLLTRVPMVGDEEQYASAFALMARHFGYPARVVMGFAPDVTSGASTVDVTGSDITAWVEVAFEDVGWVPFYPTPTQTDAPQEQSTSSKSDPLPQVRQPPRANQDQNNQLSPVAIDTDDDEEAGFEIPGWAFVVAGAIGIPLALYFVPLLIVAGVKRRRRRRRKNKGSADVRTAGAWDELTDVYAELGYSLNRKSSRLQVAAEIQEQFADQLGRREREREAKQARAAAKVQRKQKQSEISDGVVQHGAPVEVTGLTGWTPSVTPVDTELPGMPELYNFASHVDEAVFSGRDVPDSVVESVWSSTLDSAKAARGSVTWLRRHSSKFRVRSQRDWLEVLTKAGGISLPLPSASKKGAQ